MGLFDYFRRRAYERRYRAAFVVLLADYTFRRLSASDQERVHQYSEKYLLEAGILMPVFPKGSPFWTESYLLTMHRLGIPPAIAGLSWGVPDTVWETPIGPLGPLGPAPERRWPTIEWHLLRQFRPYDPATAAAQRDLIAKGAVFPTPADEADTFLARRAEYLREYKKRQVR